MNDAYIIGQENFDSWSIGFDIDGYLKVLPHPEVVVAYKDPFLLWQQDHANYKNGIFVSEGADGSYYSSWGPDEVLEVTLDMSVLEEIVVDGFGIIEEGDHFIDWLGKATPYDIFRAYNSRIPGPMLITEPGDTIKITLNNNLDEITNLHTHGLHVSPVGNGDNVLITVAPGDSWDIEIEIPEDHFIGPDWYHPHYHGETNEQVASGLGGYLLINPPYDLPDLDKFDPVENPAFFMAIQSFGIQQEYRFPSPDDPLNQSPFGTFVPAGTPLLQSTVFDFEAEYALENIFSPIPGTNLFEVNIDGSDPNSPFPFITGLIYGTIDQNGQGRFNSDPSVFGLTGFESGFVALEDGNGNRIYGTDDASSQVNFFSSTVDASGEVILTGGDGLFSGVTGTLSLSEDGIFNPDPTQPYIADLTVEANFTVPRPIDGYEEGIVKYTLAEAPFVGYNAKPVFYNPEQPQGFPVPGPNFSSAYGEGGLAEPVENVIHTINGQYNPTIETTTGAWNLFSFANMTVNSFHVIQLYKEEADGSLTLQDMILTAIDG
ncbi:MAG: multicopper oxidase domain-containing protein, partial [Synechocystis sp.]|nr:multicopper oxidase domain-containing protein [Synechocystis sp.]